MAEAPIPLDGRPPEGRLLAGFDAGQTHTTCRLARPLADGRLQLVAEGTGPGVSHLAAPGGEDRFGEALTRSLAAARDRGAEPGGPDTLLAVAVGASGIESGTGGQPQGRALAARALGMPARRVWVGGDERTALWGALADRAGIVVISGTGCIAAGHDGRGREHRCGGWGWQLDRAGSACDIGRDALVLSLEMADGRRPDGTLREALWQALGRAAPGEEGINPGPISPQQIKALVVAPGFGAADFARLAPVVEACAAAGDAEARAVLDRSARGLAELARGVAKALELERPVVCGLGGALTHLGQFAAAYRRALLAALPGARPRPPRSDACQGALELAAQLAASQFSSD